MEPLIEVQLDGLPGPTFHYSGLAPGNLASEAHAHTRSHPRLAALQGLAKMRLVQSLGIAQAFLPPLPRPDLRFLHRCGLRGTLREVMAQAGAPEHRGLLRMAQSSAFMWTANLATVIPGGDSAARCCQIVGANLISTPHRAVEAPERIAQLRSLVQTPNGPVIHDPLPATPALGDEGAANHTRLAAPDHPGVHLFIHGRTADRAESVGPERHQARQTREASEAVARLAGLDRAVTIHARAHPGAIDAGVFHGDVALVGDGDRLLLHVDALTDPEATLGRLSQLLPSLRIRRVESADLPLPEAVSSYLFNSQILTTPGGRVLIAPAQAAEGRSGRILARLREEGFIDRVVVVDLGQSMANGGGPACLRLRLPLTAMERSALHPGIILDPGRLDILEAWVRRWYPEHLDPGDLADFDLAERSLAATEDLAVILGLPSSFAVAGP